MNDYTMSARATASPPAAEGASDLLWHDIRSAVGDIIGGASLIDITPLDPQSEMQFLRVQAAAELVRELIDQASEGAEEPSNTADRSSTSLFEFVRTLERRWRAHAQAMCRELEVEMAVNLPPVISPKSLILNRIISNMISNSLRHAAAGSVKLRVDMRSDNTLRFTVLDEGEGFSDAQLSWVFDAAPAPTANGGRGLVITRNLAATLGGNMTFGKADSGGAEVALLLPEAAWRLTAEQAAHHMTPDQSDLPSLENYRVLVAEDNETNQLVISQMLSRLGADYEIASDGITALDLARTGRFDLALVDIEMPGLSGIGVIEGVRATPGPVAKMPLLAITAYVLRTHRDRIYTAGADGLLAKPIVGLKPFAETLVALLERTEQPAVAHPTPDAAAVVPLPTALFAPERLENLLAMSGAEMGQELMRRLDHDLRHVCDGLAPSTGEASFEAVRRHTHVLVSLAGAIGATRLQALAQDLNTTAHREDRPTINRSLPEVVNWVNGLVDAFQQETNKRFGSTEYHG